MASRRAIDVIKQKGDERAPTATDDRQDAGAAVRVLDLPGLPPKGDVIDWAASGGTGDQLRGLILNATWWERLATPDGNDPDAPGSYPLPPGTPIKAPGRPRKARKPPLPIPDFLKDGCRDEKGKLVPNLASAMTALRDAPELAECFALDKMLRTATLVKPLPGIGPDNDDLPRPVRDTDVAQSILPESRRNRARRRRRRQKRLSAPGSIMRTRPARFYTRSSASSFKIRTALSFSTAGSERWQRRPDGNGGWIKGEGCLDGVRRVPYRLPALIEAVANGSTIVIVEGEVKVDLLRGWNIPATCNSEGAKKWRLELCAYFKDADVDGAPKILRVVQKHCKRDGADAAFFAFPAKPLSGFDVDRETIVAGPASWAGAFALGPFPHKFYVARGNHRLERNRVRLVN
jgi:hypothetical protein